ncbi:putative epoxide hydrolase [Diaporthe ampelina]|uniref:Putative epoxide hydrolase n=1 Tax=Diaporthe ampelina TaxID=1214573 RepID=A0A0G2G0S1_9PEZI|nr:putative epoxide hydrolase [Diaporthe ampelina]
MLNLYTSQEQAGLKAAQDYQDSGSYYLHIMRTRPQTVGAMLADSPVALLAWIYEKLITWTDNYPWTDQEVCEWGFSYFPKEIAGTPRMWNRQLGDVVFEKEQEKGGHFAAWEQPEALVKDIREMFRSEGSAYRAMHQE